MTGPSSQDRRKLGAVSATAIVAGSMLGIGVFLTPRLVAAEVSSLAWYLALWGFGGVVAGAGACAYAELGAMMPRAGGDYVYLRHTYGRSLGFAAGWLLFTGVFGGSIASMSAAVCEYQIPVLLHQGLGLDLAQELPWFGSEGNGPRWGGALLILLLTGINALGVRVSAVVQTLVTVVPVALLAGFAVYGLATVPHETAVAASSDAERPLSGMAVAMLHIYFAYAGWNAISYVGGEVRNPARTLPRSLFLGTAIITILYLLLAGFFAVVLGMGGLPQAFEAGTASATALFGESATVWVAGLIAIALLGSVNATILAGARIGFAMGRDSVLPASLGTVGASRGAPTRALWLQAGFAGLLLLSGTFSELVEMTSLAMFVLGGLTVTAMFVLRAREPEVARPYRAFGYPWFPAIYLAVSLVVITLKIHGTVEQGWTSEGFRGRPWFPLFGVALFLLMFAAHRLFRSPATTQGIER